MIELREPLPNIFRPNTLISYTGTSCTISPSPAPSRNRNSRIKLQRAEDNLPAGLQIRQIFKTHRKFLLTDGFAASFTVTDADAFG